MQTLSHEETINYYVLLINRLYLDLDRTLDPLIELERYKREGGISRIDFYNSTSIEIIEEAIMKYQTGINNIVSNNDSGEL